MAHRLKRWLGATPLMLIVVLAASAGQKKDRVFGHPDVWQWAPSRTYHVENYKLKLRFDEPKGEVFGDEVVTLQPFEANFHKFYLNSSELKIDSVSLESSQGASVKLTYAAQDPRLWITLDHDYDASSMLKVRIVYHGFPRTGLFFVNPTPNYPNWPQEVYSQGETEFNHSLVSVLGLSKRHGHKRDGHDGSRRTKRGFERQAGESDALRGSGDL